MNAELRRLLDEDQADRRELPVDVDAVQAMRTRDRARRQRVDELLASGAAQEGFDFHNAAVIFQHGEESSDYWRAYELAQRATELGCPHARVMAATAYDRWLMSQLRPQKYGTQFLSVGGRWQLWDLDPATTDTERAAWGVPPLQEMVALLQQEWGEPPTIDPDLMPEWMQEVLRWMGGSA
jgi:hypothetical protein